MKKLNEAITDDSLGRMGKQAKSWNILCTKGEEETVVGK